MHEHEGEFCGEEGEMEVVGHGEISIRLKHKPREVKVCFVGEPTHIPCNPHHFDELEWEFNESPMERHGRHRDLEISWRVFSGPRVVEWEVLY